jgi:hypothetical protein
VVVASSVVADESVPPEVVDAQSHAQDVGVVQLVVVANPGSHESPKGLNFGVGTKPGDLLRFSLCRIRFISFEHLLSTGLHQRLRGASLAVKGV